MEDVEDSPHFSIDRPETQRVAKGGKPRANLQWGEEGEQGGRKEEGKENEEASSQSL